MQKKIIKESSKVWFEGDIHKIKVHPPICFFFYGFLFMCVCECVCRCQRRPEEHVRSPGVRVTGRWACWELNAGLLARQEVILTAEHLSSPSFAN